MDKIKYHIPQFILGILFGLVVVSALIYLSGLGHKIDIIYGAINKPVSCNSLPYGMQDKIEQMSNTLSEDTTCNPNK